MIELITGISILASTVSLHMSAIGAATSTASTTDAATTTATTTVQEQTMDQTQVERLVSYKTHVTAYFADTPMLIDIARCESEFRQYDRQGNLIRGRVNDQDVGIMQINEKYHLEKSKSLGYDIYTVEGNLAYAKYIYEKQGGAPWSASQKCWSKYSPTDASIAMK
ncbi:MAG: hypothetical protein RIT04_368 [Candidatus Parcubacteria bacterium]|jgi:hypothetical protein